jgi:epsin
MAMRDVDRHMHVYANTYILVLSILSYYETTLPLPSFNQAKPKTDVEARVYEVLSHKNWGSSSTLLNEISQDTGDYEKFAVISMLMWEAMENQRPAAWRVVFKGLVLLEHLLKNGSERCVDDARNHLHTLKALHKFNYYEGTVDRGSGVREKAKQIVELLADDERVREERQKSRKMRDKLGNLQSKSGGPSGMASGYDNDNWNSTSSGYGDGGIGAKNKSSDRYAGRYDDDRDTRAPAPSARVEPTPTFAALPEKKTKKKQKTPVVAAPEVDLFSFDTPAPAAVDDDFDAFQSAGDSAPAPVDPFAAPAAPSFDPFGTAPMAPPVVQQFGAFATSMPVSNTNMAFTTTNAMGNPTIFQPMTQPMGGGLQFNSMPAKNQVAFGHSDNDDFGDFEDAAAAPAMTAGSSDPLSKLISLDGLSKNSKKQDKLNEPIIANAAAAVFVQEKEQIQAAVKLSAKGNSMSFAGIDGLHKSGMMMMGNMVSPALSMPSNPSVMGGGLGADAISSLFDPTALPARSQPVQPTSGMMANPQMMMMPNQQMMMPNQQMMGAGMMGTGSQGMMPNQQMMMGGNMMGNNNMMMMNPDMTQQQTFGGGGMQGQTMMMMTPQQQQQQMMMMNGGMGMQGGMQPNPMMNGQQQPQGGNMNQMGGFR